MGIISLLSNYFPLFFLAFLDILVNMLANNININEDVDSPIKHLCHKAQYLEGCGSSWPTPRKRSTHP